ncbi:PD-(D/E)XK nuclease-like domain-containing protein [Lysinibacillus fusiformis]|uniref:PD-(D/E)XK nuclease-like domain-containing protein n=1 Tax=Lysinibacillus fusiformis TaxID=28031 RepID=UPI003D037FB1
MARAPGVFEISADEYHGDAALSSSGARRLLAPSCPAKFHYERTNPIEPTSEMQFGTVVHSILLGGEDDLAVIDVKTWQSAAAKAAKEEAELAGKIPVKLADYQVAKAMVSVIRSHPLAGPLFRGGQAEQSLFWTDKETGVDLRARPDQMKLNRRRPLVVDLKTSGSAEPFEFGRSIDDYNYHIQQDFYLAGIRALDLAKEVDFVFVVVEKKPPYLITVGQLDAVSAEAGHFYARKAIRLYADCVAHNDWPEYGRNPGEPRGLAVLSLPPWAQNEYFRES